MAELKIIHKLQLKIFDQTLQRSVVFRIDGLRCLQEGFAMLLDRSATGLHRVRISQSAMSM